MTKAIEGLKNEIIAAESNIAMCEKNIENCNGQIENFVEFFNYGIESDKGVDFLTVSARGIADALKAVEGYEKNITNYRKKIAMCEEEMAEIENVNNAKAAEKVAFFENLKKTHDGKIFVGDVLEAWDLATCTLGKLEKNDVRTTNAGYAILENSDGDWVSALNDRFEVNLATGQTFNIWTDSAAIENAKNYAWDEVEEGIFHAKNADEKTFWLNVCKAKFVNSLITLGVKDLIAAEIIRNAELEACIDDYIVDVDAAAEVEIENAEKGKIDMPSVEKIFAAVTTEIKPNIRGKYFVQINDNWRGQSVRESFATLEDAVKIARFMHSKLRKVSRHIETAVEARTVDITKYCFRSDDWTTLFEIDNYGSEKVLRRETVEAIAKIDNRTVEEVRNDIGRCTDNYGIYKNSAAVEEVNELCYYETKVVTVSESEIKAAVSEYKSIGEHFDDIMDVSVDESLPNWEREQEKLEKRHYATERKAKVKFLRDFFKSIGIPKKTLKIIVDKDVVIRNCVKEIEVIYFEPQTEKINQKQLEKIAEYFNDSHTETSVVEFDDDFAYDVLGEEDAEIEIKILSETAPYDTPEVKTEKETFKEKILAKADILKAKIAEQKKRPRKKVIDWDALYNEVDFSEVKNLQKEFKKFLKLGEMQLAENVFNNIKLIFRNHRSQLAA